MIKINFEQLFTNQHHPSNGNVIKFTISDEYYGAAEPQVRSIKSPVFRWHRGTLILLDYHSFGRMVLVKVKTALAGR